MKRNLNNMNETKTETNIDNENKIYKLCDEIKKEIEDIQKEIKETKQIINEFENINKQSLVVKQENNFNTINNYH